VQELLLLAILYHSRILVLGLRDIRACVREQIDSFKEARDTVLKKMISWVEEENELHQTLTEMVEIFHAKRPTQLAKSDATKEDASAETDPSPLSSSV
jgi:hypothetical protein